MKMMLVLLAGLVCLVPQAALATSQFPDLIYLEGRKQPLFSNPLEQYYGPGNPRPPFRSPNTATWRGYIATWEIDRGVLYLQAIRAWTERGEVGLAALFPGHQGRVAATWFSGQLRVPQGKILKPGVGYRAVYEKDLMITVEQGRVVGQKIIDHTGAERPPGRL